MCVVSMVFDYYDKTIPWPAPNKPYEWYPPLPPVDLDKQIKDFLEALQAAKKVDKLTAQPDCEDPEKAKLLDRVAELEKRLAAIEKPKAKRKPRKAKK